MTDHHPTRPDLPGVCDLDLTRLKEDGLPVLIEEKKDGWRLSMRCGQGGPVGGGEAYGRDPDTDLWDSLPGHIRVQAHPEWVDGELTVEPLDGKGTAAQVATALADCRRKGPGGPPTDLRFTAFHLLERQLDPAGHRDTLMDLGFDVPWAYGGDADPYMPVAFLDPAHLLQEAADKGIEGWVIKQKSTTPYWSKLKVTHTIDLVVTGLKPGKGDWQGKVGAVLGSVIVDGKQVEVASVSGFSHDVRDALGQTDLGRVIEVAFDDWTSPRKGDPRLKHPRFVRFRDDKPAGECKAEGR